MKDKIVFILILILILLASCQKQDDTSLTPNIQNDDQVITSESIPVSSFIHNEINATNFYNPIALSNTRGDLLIIWKAESATDKVFYKYLDSEIGEWTEEEVTLFTGENIELYTVSNDFILTTSSGSNYINIFNTENKGWELVSRSYDSLPSEYHEYFYHSHGFASENNLLYMVALRLSSTNEYTLAMLTFGKDINTWEFKNEKILVEFEEIDRSIVGNYAISLLDGRLIYSWQDSADIGFQLFMQSFNLNNEIYSEVIKIANTQTVSYSGVEVSQTNNGYGVLTKNLATHKANLYLCDIDLLKPCEDFYEISISSHSNDHDFFILNNTFVLITELGDIEFTIVYFSSSGWASNTGTIELMKELDLNTNGSTFFTRIVSPSSSHISSVIINENQISIPYYCNASETNNVCDSAKIVNLELIENTLSPISTVNLPENLTLDFDVFKFDAELHIVTTSESLDASSKYNLSLYGVNEIDNPTLLLNKSYPYEVRMPSFHKIDESNALLSWGDNSSSGTRKIYEKGSFSEITNEYYGFNSFLSDDNNLIFVYIRDGNLHHKITNKKTLEVISEDIVEPNTNIKQDFKIYIKSSFQLSVWSDCNENLCSINSREYLNNKWQDSTELLSNIYSANNEISWQVITNNTTIMLNWRELDNEDITTKVLTYNIATKEIVVSESVLHDSEIASIKYSFIDNISIFLFQDYNAWGKHSFMKVYDHTTGEWDGRIDPQLPYLSQFNMYSHNATSLALYGVENQKMVKKNFSVREKSWVIDDEFNLSNHILSNIIDHSIEGYLILSWNKSINGGLDSQPNLLISADGENYKHFTMNVDIPISNYLTGYSLFVDSELNVSLAWQSQELLENWGVKSPKIRGAVTSLSP